MNDRLQAAVIHALVASEISRRHRQRGGMASMQWECKECSSVTSGSNRPTQCKRCGAAAERLVAVEEEDPHGVERSFESWVRHGMRTKSHWRALTFCLAFAGLVTTRAAADRSQSPAPPASCAATGLCAAATAMSLLPPLLCPVCTAPDTLASELQAAKSTVCGALAVLPLVPALPGCAPAPARQAARHTTARM